MSNLVTVEFETSLGAVYKFPDMDHSMLLILLADFTHSERIVLVNASDACLQLPSRIVKLVRVNGEECWRRP